MGRRRLGGREVNRGEIRWYTFRAPDKRRPEALENRKKDVAGFVLTR